MNLKDAKAEVERTLVIFLEDELVDPDDKDTAKLLLWGIFFGCKSIDKLAEASGLARDRFVRPRARRLREAGIWTREGLVGFETLDRPAQEMSIEFIVHMLVADGLVIRSVSKPTVSPGLVENPSVEHVPASGTGV
jgi:hypothetical protein